MNIKCNYIECNSIECNSIKCNSIEVTNTYSNLSNQTKFRLNEINKIRDYFNSEIQQRKIMSKKLSKYIASFNYFDKILFYLQQVEE